MLTGRFVVFQSRVGGRAEGEEGRGGGRAHQQLLLLFVSGLGLAVPHRSSRSSREDPKTRRDRPHARARWRRAGCGRSRGTGPRGWPTSAGVIGERGTACRPVTRQGEEEDLRIGPTRREDGPRVVQGEVHEGPGLQVAAGPGLRAMRASGTYMHVCVCARARARTARSAVSRTCSPPMINRAFTRGCDDPPR